MTNIRNNNINNDNNIIINNKIKYLEQIPGIQIYKNKIFLFTRLINYKTCSICLDDNVLNIKMDCCHDICIECYEHNMKCYYNWCKE